MHERTPGRVRPFPSPAAPGATTPPAKSPAAPPRVAGPAARATRGTGRRDRWRTAARRAALAVAALLVALPAGACTTNASAPKGTAPTAAAPTSAPAGSAGAEATGAPPATALAMLNLLGGAGLQWATPNGAPQDRTAAIDSSTDAGKNETSLATARTAASRVQAFVFSTPAARAAAQPGLLADPDQAGESPAPVACANVLVVVSPSSPENAAASGRDVAAVTAAVAKLTCPT